MSSTVEGPAEGMSAEAVAQQPGGNADGKGARGVLTAGCEVLDKVGGAIGRAKWRALIRAARRRFECKNCERVNVWDALDQAAAHFTLCLAPEQPWLDGQIPGACLSLLSLI